MWRDTTIGTVTVAAVLCIVCSLVVSGFAVGLKEIQEQNAELDKKKNVLLAARMFPEDPSDPNSAQRNPKSKEVDELYEKKIKELFVDLETGKVVEMPEGYDPDKASKAADQRVDVEPANALMGVRYRAPVERVYQIVEGDQVEGYIFPVYGKGLWGTLFGFLALDADGSTVRGITFYKHKETPGLGGEVDNKKWKASWVGKKIYGEGGEVKLDVVKGLAGNEHQIDGLSGATITSKGVDHLVDYWLGEEGFGLFLETQKNASQASAQESDAAAPLATSTP